LRSLPEVDASRIGLTGISWGGFLVNIVAGVDDRFAFVAPVYGCGFLGENSSWQEKEMQEMGRERAVKWLTLWDPSQWLGQAKMAMLFCNGTNDRHYRPDSWQKTYRLVAGARTLSLKVRMPHGHPPEGDPEEITVFADSLLKGKPGLPRILTQGRDGREAWASFASDVEVTQAELVYTTDKGNWVQRRWSTLPAEIHRAGNRVSAAIPATATVYYLNLRDARGCIVSTEHEETSEGH